MGFTTAHYQTEKFTEAKATGLPVDLAAVLARGFMPRASGDPKGRPLTCHPLITSGVFSIARRISFGKGIYGGFFFFYLTGRPF